MGNSTNISVTMLLIFSEKLPKFNFLSDYSGFNEKLYSKKLSE